MSTASGRRVSAERLAAVGAAAAVAVVAASYLRVLYGVVDVTGDVTAFLAVVAGAVVLAVIVARAVRWQTAVVVAALLLTAGLGLYLQSLPPERTAAIVGNVATDLASMLTGYSVLGIVAAGTWALAVAPAPTFLVAYFTVRRNYVRAAAVAGLALGFFVLTGDSTTTGTLVGVVGAASAAGLASIARHGTGRGRLEGVVVAVAVMIVAASTVTAVPAGVGSSPGIGVSGGTSGDLVSADERMRIGGSIDLSPTVRFVVDADRGRYWRATAYDRFTGTGWVRTGGDRPVAGNLGWPTGPRERLEQRVEAKKATDVLPAAAEPVAVDGVDARVTDLRTVEPASGLAAGENYTVVSAVPTPSERRLRDAGTEYPEWVRDRYLQLPASTSDRFRAAADNITADAATPYAKARTVERYLEENKGYTTAVVQPSGSIPESFLFEMDAGYCVYFATTMVALLRAEGVPARFAVGYTSGRQRDDGSYVVRGLDSHAWVEVYFPDVGWVRFDPTPADPRTAAERSALEAARNGGQPNVDPANSENATTTTTATTNRTTAAPNATTGTETATATGGGGETTTAADPTLPSLPSLPPPEVLALWGVVVVGMAAAGHRSGLTERAYRAAWLRWQPESGDPVADAVGAYARVEYLLGRRARPREAGETVRQYLDAVEAGPRAREVAAIRERALYGGGVDAADAARARTLAADIVRGRGDGGGDSV